MRSAILGLSLVFVAGSATAAVHLTVKHDGTKLIYSDGMSSGDGAVDLKWLASRHDRRSKYDPIIERYAEKYGVDATLIRAVIQVESNFDPRSVSRKGARGLMQLMPDTAERFGVKAIHDPDQNIHGGVRYLAYLLTLFNKDLPRALAAYNAGESAVLKYGGIPPYDETSQYVTRAMTVYHGHPYGTTTATAFAGKRGGPKLKGGFGAGLVEPLAAALIPGAKYLGTR